MIGQLEIGLGSEAWVDQKLRRSNACQWSRSLSAGLKGGATLGGVE